MKVSQYNYWPANCLASLLLLSGCGSGSALSEGPVQGAWRGDQAAFQLEAGVLSGWWLQGMYCEGSSPSPCLALPTGVPSASTELDGDAFTLTLGPFNLEGRFVTSERVEGQWSIEDPECCSSTGPWAAVLVEALPTPTPELDAHEADAQGEDSGEAPLTPLPTPSAPTNEAEVCALWESERSDLREATWSGNSSTCDISDIDAEARERVLRQVNLYRALAGLPAFELDEAFNQLAQSCSVLMDANATIDHFPPDSWACFSDEGAKGASESNLATAPAVFAVDLYMEDTGNASTMGHRRWILQNGLGPIGVGSTNAFSCLHVLGSTSVDPVAWTAWPPPGAMPSAALFTIESVAWSFHTHIHSSLADAEVTVRAGAEELEVEVWPLAGGYGGSEALAFRPIDWSVEPGGTYEVHLTGIEPPVSYSVSFPRCDLQ